jgi:hypothetical protein
MAITSKGTSSPSPDRDAAKLGRPEGAPPGDPKLTPDNLARNSAVPKGRQRTRLCRRRLTRQRGLVEPARVPSGYERARRAVDP